MKHKLLVVILILICGFTVWKLTSLQLAVNIAAYNYQVKMNNLSKDEFTNQLLTRWELEKFTVNTEEFYPIVFKEPTIWKENDTITLHLGCSEKYQFKDIDANGAFNMKRVFQKTLVGYICKPSEIQQIEQKIIVSIGRTNVKGMAYLNNGKLEIHIPKSKSILFFRRTGLNKDAIYQQLTNDVWKLKSMQQLDSFDPVKSKEPILKILADRSLSIESCGTKLTANENDIASDGKIVFTRSEVNNKKCNTKELEDFDTSFSENTSKNAVIRKIDDIVQVLFPDMGTTLYFSNK